MGLPLISPTQARGLAEETNQLFDISLNSSDVGKRDSLRFRILHLVADEKYDQAIKAIEDHFSKKSPYPDYKKRIERYVTHCTDLCFAIKTKRNFPGISSLTRAKQQELREKFREHFDELKFYLKKMEKVEVDLRVVDAKSTIYVVQALWFATIGILSLALFLEIARGLAATSYIVYDFSLSKGLDLLFSFF